MASFAAKNLQFGTFGVDSTSNPFKIDLLRQILTIVLMMSAEVTPQTRYVMIIPDLHLLSILLLYTRSNLMVFMFVGRKI